MLVARAAAKDGLQWWDDESLTDGGLTLAARIFSRRPERAAARLALRSALARHAAALERFPNAIHLFRLSELFEMDLDNALAFEDLGPLQIPPSVATMDELRERLVNLGADLGAAGKTPGDSRLLRINVPVNGSDVDYARALAAGYLAGEHGRAIFPYLLPSS